MERKLEKDLAFAQIFSVGIAKYSVFVGASERDVAAIARLVCSLGKDGGALLVGLASVAA